MNRTISPRFNFQLDVICGRLFSPFHLAACLAVALCAFGPVSAQNGRPEGDQSHGEPAVVVAATDTGARFTAASGGAVEMRLEVFSFLGAKVFDSDFRSGGVIDWVVGGGDTGQSAQSDDDYLCVVTLRSLSGRLRQRRGITSLRSGRVTLPQPGASQLSAAQVEASVASRSSQLVEKDGEDEDLTVISGEASSLIVTAHDGQVGQLTSTTGALTFRTGDVFAGREVERVRITPEGNVGIGTAQPKAMLDVAGDIRSTGFLRLDQGIEFADGTLQTTGLSGRKDKDGNVTPNVAGTGTQNYIAKWTDNLGTLGDSLLGEIAGGIELRPALAGVGINPTLTNPGNVAGFAQLGFYPAAGPNVNMSFSVVPRGTGVANNRAQFSVFNTDLVASPINYEFAALRARGSDFVFGTGKSGTGVNRPIMFASGFLSDNTTNNGQFFLASNGNVGVGTVSPVEKLDVVGNINTSTQYNLGGGRVLSNGGFSNLFAGVGAGNVNTTGGNNSFFGSSAGAADTTGGNNSFFGARAGTANTIGQNNSFFGRDAGTANTSGSSNSFFGSNAGIANTTGNINSFFGLSAGAANTSGAGGSFFGALAGTANTTGANNSFFGNAAGAANTTGSSNAFFGNGAGNENTAGSSNSFFGRSAGAVNTASNNSFFGNSAGEATTSGGSNSFLGDSAGANNTSGSTNTFVGVSTGVSNTTESANTFIGANSNGSAGITNATAVGANAVVTQSDSLVLGNGVKVGVGSSTPSEKLHVVGNIFVGGNPAVGANGLILRSPNGVQCAKLTIDNAGSLITSAVVCP